MTLENQQVSAQSPSEVARNVQKNRQKHLTAGQIKALARATETMTHATRDRAMMWVSFRLGLRVSELCNLRLGDLDMVGRKVQVNRLKGSESASIPLRGEAFFALEAWLRERPKCKTDRVFVSQHKAPFTRFGLNYLVAQWGEKAGLPFKVHPHMLRHACGYDLVNRPGGSKDLRLIGALLGHKDLKNTVMYTALAEDRFDELYGDEE